MTEETGERVQAATEAAEAPAGGAVQIVEIAAALILSERMVAKHLDRIFVPGDRPRCAVGDGRRRLRDMPSRQGDATLQGECP